MTCKDCVHYQVCEENGIYYTDEYIKGITTTNDVKSLCVRFKNKADVVNVVRCKDCRLYEPNIECSGYEPDGYCNWFDCGAGGLDFCSYGERK